MLDSWESHVAYRGNSQGSLKAHIVAPGGTGRGEVAVLRKAAAPSPLSSGNVCLVPSFTIPSQSVCLYTGQPLDSIEQWSSDINQSHPEAY